MAGKSPPRYVPTLTEVVKGVSSPSGPQQPGALTEEQLVKRVMQRVDLALDGKLREAIAAAVIEQTRAMAPTLREHIETVIRKTVAQAFADERAADTRGTR